MAFVSGFPVPKSVEINENTATSTYGEFTVEPLQAGFGHTIGNSIRRVLLSSLEGSAISAVRIDGVSHEFATIPNIIEDVTEIILNLKQVKLLCHTDSPKMLEIKKNTVGKVTAGDITTDGTIEVLNPKQLICTLDKKTTFRAEIEISIFKDPLSAKNQLQKVNNAGFLLFEGSLPLQFRCRDEAYYALEWHPTGILANRGRP